MPPPRVTYAGEQNWGAAMDMELVDRAALFHKRAVDLVALAAKEPSMERQTLFLNMATGYGQMAQRAHLARN